MAATGKAKKNCRPQAGIPKKVPKAQLTPAQAKFHELLRLCLPQERLFIRAKLERKTHREAVVEAGYSAKTADTKGSQLLTLSRVWDAYQAGLEAAGFGAADILDDIQALRSFDRSQIEREVLELTTELVERRAEDVIQELITKERAVQDFLDGLDVDDESIVRSLRGKLKSLLHQRLDLEMAVAVDPDATTFVEVQRTVTNRVIDYDLAKEKGLNRFIKGKRPTKFGEVVELHDWVTGVEMGARAMGVFRERHELTGKDGEPLAQMSVLVLPSNGREG